MKFKNQSKFCIKCLNQEKLLNNLSKEVSLSDIDRKNKSDTTFKCSYFDRKKVENLLKSKQVEYSVEDFGLCSLMRKIFTSYGLISAILFSVCLYFFQYQYIWQYEINGVELLDKTQVVSFVKEKYSNKKSKLDTEEIEVGLIDNFEEISFASCIVKGQTLVVNIKEKLMPEQMYGEFKPIVAKRSGKISKINLISGTAKVKVGEIVRLGDILVEPYTIDTSGEIMKVEAKAEIEAEVYNEASVDHYDKFIEVKRTGRKAEQNDIKLFGLSIYRFKEDINFEMYEVEYEDVDLIRNLFLPFKMQKTVYYELSETLVESRFEDVKDEYIEKAREKALENCLDCDKIKEEYYTLRHLSGVTIVNYCIVSEEQIGGFQ